LGLKNAPTRDAGTEYDLAGTNPNFHLAARPADQRFRRRRPI
jgi:hypothetical protein